MGESQIIHNDIIILNLRRVISGLKALSIEVKISSGEFFNLKTL
jgi:hypothetical protein